MHKDQYLDPISRAKYTSIKYYAKKILETLMGVDESMFPRFMYRHLVNSLSLKCGVYRGSGAEGATISNEDIDRSIYADEIKQLQADVYAMCYILDNIRRLSENKTIEKITMNHRTTQGVVDCVLTIAKSIDSSGKVIHPRRAIIIQHSFFDGHSPAKTYAGLAELVETPVFDGAILVDTGAGVRYKSESTHSSVLTTTADSVIYALEELLKN